MKCQIKPIFCIGKCHYEDDADMLDICRFSHLSFFFNEFMQNIPIFGRLFHDYHCPYFEIRKDETNATQPEKQ